MTTVTLKSPKKKGIALILCFILGIVGAHHFYVGRTGRGFKYMFTAGLLGIGWFMDIVNILSNNFKDNCNQPLRDW